MLKYKNHRPGFNPQNMHRAHKGTDRNQQTAAILKPNKRPKD